MNLRPHRTFLPRWWPTGRRWLRPGPFTAPILLLAVETAPVSLDRNASGRWELHVGGGIGEMESRSYSCEGNLLRTDRVDFAVGGAKLDYKKGNLRVTPFAGYIEADDTAPAGQDEDFRGPFGGVQIAGEWRVIGAGAGISAVGGSSQDERFVGPSVYFRIGRLDAAHFRLDVLQPSEGFAATGWLRTGVAFNQGTRPGTRGFLGINFFPYTYENETAPRFFGELDFPVSPVADILLRGQVGAGESHLVWTAGGGVGIRFGGSGR